MSWNVVYKGSFLNVESDIDNLGNQKQMDIYIYDTESGNDSPDSTIIQLEMADSPLRRLNIDNDEDKFTVVKPTKYEINIHSSDTISIDTFASGGDNRWQVWIDYAGVRKFKGWMSISHLQQDFLPNPNIISLTATDGLNFAADRPLVDFDGENPKWENRIIDYLAWALNAGTGLQLPIVVSFNIREAGAIYLNQEGHSPHTGATVFQTSPTVAIRLNPTDWFYPGQIFTTDDGSNPGPFTVVSVVQGSGYTDVFVSESFTPGVNTSVTFTDLAEVGDGHFFRHEWLLAKSAEDDINTSISCRLVIEKILSEQAFICQRNASWVISRIDELETTRDLYLFTFDYQGNFVSRTTSNPIIEIGIDELRTWMNDNQIYQIERSVREVIETYPLEPWKEVLTNYDFSRGDSVSDTEITPEAWVLETGYPVLLQTTAQGYIKRELTDGQEVSRYLYIEPFSSNIYLAFRNKERIYAHTGDKFRVSIDWKHDINEGGSGHYRLPVAMIRLWADDGTHWHLNMSSGYGSSDPTSYWIESNASWTTNTRYLYHEGDFGQDDLSQWQTASGTCAPVPKNGRIEVFFVHNFKADTRGKAFSAVTFEYLPYYAGTYEKYKSYRYKISQELNTVAKRENVVGVSDSLKKGIKWALLKESGSEELHTGSIVFAAPNVIALALGSGYNNYLFTEGKRIRVTGTNAGMYKIDTVNYSAIPDRTEITVKEQTISTVTETATISEVLFELANSFYNAQVFPDGVPDENYLHPYGHIQALDVWNQYNRNMRKFEGDIDRLDDDDDFPDLTHKYLLTDPSNATTNKLFMAITIESDIHLCESKVFFNEVFADDIPKSYPEPETKFSTL